MAKQSESIKTALVTGASAGIGAAIVQYLLIHTDYNIVTIARSKVDDVKLYGDEAARVKSIQLDLAKPIPSDIQLLDQGQPLDILIHNAGALKHAPFGKTTRQDWEEIFAVNVFGVVELTQRLLPNLRFAERPHIVTIGSMGGYQGAAKFAGLAAYSASKGALATLTQCLAVELASDNISANCLCLGAVNTAMLRTAFPGYVAPVSSDTMAAYIVNFALTAASVMNGQIVPVAINDPT